MRNEVSILENWAVVMSGDPYTAPEMRTQCLTGNVIDHSSFDDGAHITTSYIVGKRKIREDYVVVTYSGRMYKLVEVNNEYDSLYPDAYNRLINSLPEV